MYEEFLDAPCWQLCGRTDVTVALTALFDLLDDSHTLVMECASQSPDISGNLAAISDHSGPSETVVSFSTMSGLRYEMSLGRPIPQALVDITKHHAAPEYCANCFVFRDGKPLFLWFDFAGEQITIRPEVDQNVVEAFATLTGMALLKRER